MPMAFTDSQKAKSGESATRTLAGRLEQLARSYRAPVVSTPDDGARRLAVVATLQPSNQENWKTRETSLSRPEQRARRNWTYN